MAVEEWQLPLAYWFLAERPGGSYLETGILGKRSKRISLAKRPLGII